MEANFIDALEQLSAMLDLLSTLPDTGTPNLYLDLEGQKLSRTGTLSIVQILAEPLGAIYLIDFTTLGIAAFTTLSSDGSVSLKSLLESTATLKVFFDVRNDSDAFFSHYTVRSAGVHDLQLMELAERSFRRRFVNGLATCIERDLSMTPLQSETGKPPSRAVADSSTQVLVAAMKSSTSALWQTRFCSIAARMSSSYQHCGCRTRPVFLRNGGIRSR